MKNGQDNTADNPIASETDLLALPRFVVDGLREPDCAEVKGGA
jgi:hypothetical protein